MYTNERLLSPDLDLKAYLRYALHTTTSGTHGEQARLSACMDTVKENIQDILSEHADSMIGQLRATCQAQREVMAVRQSTDSLSKATNRLRLMIADPYLAIQSRLQELDTASAVAALLGDVLKYFSLSSRLHEQDVENDLPRAARLMREMEDLLQHVPALRGIDVIAPRIRHAERVSATVRSRAHEKLTMQGMTSGDPKDDDVRSLGLSGVVVDVGLALQCFYTLGMLSKTVQTVMAERKREVLRTIMRDLDSQSITEMVSRQSSGGGGVKHLHVAQEALLGRVQSVLFTTVQQTQAVLVLWRVLLHRRDAVTHASFFQAIADPVQMLVDYWTTVMEKLLERLVSLQSRNDLMTAFAAGYPRYIMLIDSFLSSSGTLPTPGSTLITSASAAAPNAVQLETTVMTMNVRTWGMGDYLDLIQLVEHEVVSGGGGCRSVERHTAETEHLRQVWRSQVADDPQHRFTAQVMDRHRERIGPAQTKLSAITPTTSTLGNQTVTLSVADARRGSIPAQANPLELWSYARFALQDCYAHRQYLHGLPIVVSCVVKCATQLLERMTEAVHRCPLPPLPAVTSSVTRTQLLHICIANGCTGLLADLMNILVLLPEGCEAPRREQLNGLIESLQQLAEGCSIPFLDSIRVVLIASVTPCLELSTSSGGGAPLRQNAAPMHQLRGRMDVFLTHYYLLLDARTPGWADGTRRLVDSLFARLLAQSVVTALPQVPAVNRLFLQRIQEVLGLITTFIAGMQSAGSSRSTLLLKSAVRQIELFYSSAPSTAAEEGEVHTPDRAEQYATMLKPLYPIIAQLLVLQQLDMVARSAGAPSASPAARIQWKTDGPVEYVERGLLAYCDPLLPPRSAEEQRTLEDFVLEYFALASQSVQRPSLMKEVWRLL